MRIGGEAGVMSHNVGKMLMCSWRLGTSPPDRPVPPERILRLRWLLDVSSEVKRASTPLKGREPLSRSRRLHYVSTTWVDSRVLGKTLEDSTSDANSCRLSSCAHNLRAVKMLPKCYLTGSTPAASTNLRSRAFVSELRLASHPSRVSSEAWQQRARGTTRRRLSTAAAPRVDLKVAKVDRHHPFGRAVFVRFPPSQPLPTQSKQRAEP